MAVQVALELLAGGLRQVEGSAGSSLDAVFGALLQGLESDVIRNGQLLFTRIANALKKLNVKISFTEIFTVIKSSFVKK